MTDKIIIEVGDGEPFGELKEAFRALSPAPHGPNHLTPIEERAVLEKIYRADWKVFEYARDWPDPDKVPTGDQTLRDLHQLSLDIVRKQGAQALMKLFDTYKIVSLNDLPVSRFVEFYHDAYTTYHSMRTDKVE
jgi:hypothetical protein